MSAQLLVIFLGGGIGSVLRFLLACLVESQSDSDFPFDILIVNVLGCILIGLLWVLLVEKWDANLLWGSGLLVGLLGGFTTFSSFSIDAINLLLRGEYLSGALYILLSVVLCLVGTWLGILLGKAI